MPMGTERSKPLHNFTMPGGLRWGNQRFLRCMKVNSNGQISYLQRFSTTANHNNSSSDLHHRRTTRERERDPSAEFSFGSRKLRSTPPTSNDGDDGIAAMREKVMFDIQTAADKMKDAIFKDGLEEGEVPVSVSPKWPRIPESVEGEPYRPWNLRTRRAACKTQVKNPGGGGGGNDGNGKGLKVDVPKPNSFQIKGVEKLPMLRSGGNGGSGGSGEKKERPEFAVALSKRQIEEDFGAFGLRLPRRSKKRARNVQKQLDTLHPGLWLTEVTADMYKVPEAAP